ncbi:hypothetical protein SASPL_142113 [Salvia splendens]|uniref:Uncharacterized protein n=1 Tax=Salvia splendens TaxID=180675 RepID=A0A8X8WL26_SALSN|nr:hypothetical protein SASPL_142113 [Salvia splendens]
MASISAFSLSTHTSPCSLSNYPSSALSPLNSQSPCVKFRTQFKNYAISCNSSVCKHPNSRRAIVRAVAEEEGILIPEEEASPRASEATADQTVSVAVSPSDVLTMLFQAEGTMSDAAVPAVTKALQGVEGVTDLKVQVLEGIASVEHTLGLGHPYMNVASLDSYHMPIFISSHIEGDNLCSFVANKANNRASYRGRLKLSRDHSGFRLQAASIEFELSGRRRFELDRVHFDLIATRSVRVSVLAQILSTTLL